MAQQAITALKSARVYLNDINGISWTDALLFPLLQEAFGELVQELERNNCATLKFETAPSLILPGTTSISPPSNLLAPTALFEAEPEAPLANYVEMLKVASVPFRGSEMTLRSWCWQGEQIVFVSPSRTRSVIIRYEGTPPVPEKSTDPLTILFAERYLGPRIAALAYSSIQRDSKMLLSLAADALYKIIQSRVVNDQRPVRRRGFREPRVITLPGTAIIYGGGSSSGGTTVTWFQSTTVPDGNITAFVFPFRPFYVSWNGLNQFEGAGYSVASISSQYLITFMNELGQVMTPHLLDDIRAARQA